MVIISIIVVALVCFPQVLYGHHCLVSLCSYRLVILTIVVCCFKISPRGCCMAIITIIGLLLKCFLWSSLASLEICLFVFMVIIAIAWTLLVSFSLVMISVNECCLNFAGSFRNRSMVNVALVCFSLQLPFGHHHHRCLLFENFSPQLLYGHHHHHWFVAWILLVCFSLVISSLICLLLEFWWLVYCWDTMTIVVCWSNFVGLFLAFAMVNVALVSTVWSVLPSLVCCLNVTVFIFSGHF